MSLLKKISFESFPKKKWNITSLLFLHLIWKKKHILKHITNLIVGRKYLEKSVRTSVVIILLSDMCNRWTVVFLLTSGGGHLQLPGDPSDEHLHRTPGKTDVFTDASSSAVTAVQTHVLVPQVIIDTDKTTFSLRLQNQDQLDHMVSHINYALFRIFNNSIYA